MKMPEWVYLANWTPERKTINSARNKPAGWAFWQELMDCARDRIENWQEYQAWVEKWPSFCRKCGAAGGMEHTEKAAPHGSGEYWGMPVYDDCGECLGTYEMVCPRCGEEIYTAILNRDRVDKTTDDGDIIQEWYEKEKSCPLCGWNWGENPDDHAPYVIEQCWCDEKIKDRRRPGKWQLRIFQTFGERFQFLFKHPIWIMRGKD